MQGCQRARYIVSSLLSIPFKTSSPLSLLLQPFLYLRTTTMLKVTFCLHCAFWIITQSTVTTSVISSLCVRHYRIANWWDKESVEFEGFGNESTYLYLKIWSSEDLSFLYVGTRMQLYSSSRTRLCVLVCVYPISNVVQILWYSAELPLHTNTETQSKTSFFSSLFADSFTRSLTQQLDKNQHSKARMTRCRWSASYI